MGKNRNCQIDQAIFCLRARDLRTLKGICVFGYSSCLILTADLPFSTINDVIRPSSIYLPTHQARSALALSLVVNAWMVLWIAILELYPIVFSVCLWGYKMQNHCILFSTDNESLVHVINKKSCKDKSLMYNILFKAKHIPGIHNKLAWLLILLSGPNLQATAWHQLTWIAFQQTFPSTSFPEARQYSYAFDSIEPPSIIYSCLYGYMRAWKLFTQFHSFIFRTAQFTLPIYLATLALFISYMFDSINCQHIRISLN